ncbi:MAG: alpha-glucan family phosphorylase [Cytophagaceae bacterium]
MYVNRHPQWQPYEINPEYGKKVAYFSMEYAIDQSLKIYSGGLGFLAGSHMRSAYDLKQNVIGIGILWKYGYYDQVWNSDHVMEPKFVKKHYSFLQDTGIIFDITIHDAPVYVKAYYLHPETFGTAPMFFLSTDIPENDYISRTITHKLYDSNLAAKIAGSILLGVGGAKLLDILGLEPEVYHMNEGHAVPLVFYLYSKFRDIEEVRKRMVFTTHTPEKAGNEEHSIKLLEEMSFFHNIPLNEVKRIARLDGDTLNYTLTALRFAKISNGVSQIHGQVSNEMWGGNEGISKIISITNAQNKRFWKDDVLEQALQQDNNDLLLARKKELKKQLFEVVADQAGKLFDPNILTLVWARRFAGYKRAALLLKNIDRFIELVSRAHEPIQVIWAGKPYPEDKLGIEIFNYIAWRIEGLNRCAILTGHELKLSALLKKGSDLWLNNPIPPREASGTSGMTAAMNGSVNFSIADGWFPEFARHGENSFVIPQSHASYEEERDYNEAQCIYHLLEHEIIPVYYRDPGRWAHIMKQGMREVTPQFDSDRMATEYYQKLYNY